MVTGLHDLYLSKSISTTCQARAGKNSTIKELKEIAVRTGKTTLLAAKTVASVVGAFLGIALFLSVIAAGIYGTFYVTTYVSLAVGVITAAGAIAVASGIFGGMLKIFPSVKEHLDKEWAELTELPPS